MRMTEMDQQHEQFFLEAGKEAEKALCLRDRCGAVVVAGGSIHWKGF